MQCFQGFYDIIIVSNKVDDTMIHQQQTLILSPFLELYNLIVPKAKESVYEIVEIMRDKFPAKNAIDKLERSI